MIVYPEIIHSNIIHFTDKLSHRDVLTKYLRSESKTNWIISKSRLPNIAYSQVHKIVGQEAYYFN